MATELDRTRAILNALKNNVVSDELGLRIVTAFVNSYQNLWLTDPETGEPVEPIGNQRFQLFLVAMRSYVIDIVCSAESTIAAEAARLVALEAAEEEVDLEE